MTTSGVLVVAAGPAVAAVGAATVVLTLLLGGLALVLAVDRRRALAAAEETTSALRADLRRREEIERHLRQRDAELRDFIAMAIHDLRGPLSTVTAYVELVAEQVQSSLDERGRADLERVRRGLRQMSELVEELLEYARIDAAPMRRAKVDLDALVRELVRDRVSPTVVPLAHVRVGKLPTVLGDPSMLRRLIDNLLSNAVKYSAAERVPEIEITARPEEDGYRIEVADRGIGIPQSEWSAIFDAFHRVPGTGDRAGTGLGLAICRRVVTRHGGRIGVAENPGGGTRVWFTLPADRTVLEGEAASGAQAR